MEQEISKRIKQEQNIRPKVYPVLDMNATEMSIKLYNNAKKIELTVTGWETPEEIDAILQRNAIIIELYEICSDLSLDFRDFKLAFKENSFFDGENSFNRILNNGLPKKYIRNLKILKKFLNAIETTLKKCADKTYKLKYSDFETFKKQYEQYEEGGKKSQIGYTVRQLRLSGQTQNYLRRKMNLSNACNKIKLRNIFLMELRKIILKR